MKIFIVKYISYYLDLKICKKFLKYIINLRKKISYINNEKYSELSTESIRKYFEEFLEFWGLDFNLGSKLWDLYINFEKENLDFSKKNNDTQNIYSSLQIIRSIYRRRLSFPHMDLDIIWNEYKKWEVNQDDLKKVEEKYLEVKYFLKI